MTKVQHLLSSVEKALFFVCFLKRNNNEIESCGRNNHVAYLRFIHFHCSVDSIHGYIKLMVVVVNELNILDICIYIYICIYTLTCIYIYTHTHTF